MIIGLSPWVINERFLGDLSGGGHCRFALEYYCSTPLTRLDAPANDDDRVDRQPHAEHSEKGNYRIVGKVIYQQSKLLVLDIGPAVTYTEFNGDDLKIGDIVAGNVSLSVDPFADFDDADIPDLKQNWRVENILALSKHRPPENQYQKIEIAHNLKLDESGNEYFLNCSLIHQT